MPFSNVYSCTTIKLNNVKGLLASRLFDISTKGWVGAPIHVLDSRHWLAALSTPNAYCFSYPTGRTMDTKPESTNQEDDWSAFAQQRPL